MREEEDAPALNAVRKGTFPGETETPPIKLGKGMGRVTRLTPEVLEITQPHEDC